MLSKNFSPDIVGDQDLICNYIGIENMIKALTWNGQTGLGVCCFCSFAFLAILTISSDCTNTIMERQCDTCRHLGNFKIFNASHMAPFDVPHVTHDTMLRFMRVNFSAILDGSAQIPRSLGTVTKPIFVENDVESTSM